MDHEPITVKSMDDFLIMDGSVSYDADSFCMVNVYIHIRLKTCANREIFVRLLIV